MAASDVITGSATQHCGRGREGVSSSSISRITIRTKHCGFESGCGRNTSDSVKCRKSRLDDRSSESAKSAAVQRGSVGEEICGV